MRAWVRKAAPAPLCVPSSSWVDCSGCCCWIPSVLQCLATLAVSGSFKQSATAQAHSGLPVATSCAHNSQHLSATWHVKSHFSKGNADPASNAGTIQHWQRKPGESWPGKADTCKYAGHGHFTKNLLVCIILCNAYICKVYSKYST